MLKFLRRFTWRKPDTARVLLYRTPSVEYLRACIPFESISVFDPFALPLSVPILLRSILKGGRNRFDYSVEFMRCVDAEVIVTTTDNDPNFYRLKGILGDPQTIFVQNGVRGEQADVFELLKAEDGFEVDHMFVFGSNIAWKYSRYIRGKFHHLGSLRNNMVPLSRSVRDIDLLFISQYAGEVLKGRTKFLVDAFGVEYSNDDFFYSDIQVTKFLAAYVQKNNLTLHILLRSNSSDEKDFYRDFLGTARFKFIEKGEPELSYQSIDRARATVFIDSTLGYEAMARKAKTACFSVREITMKNAATRFGWPGKYADRGPFWTSIYDESVFAEILDTVLGMNDETWIATVEPYLPELMNYDPQNESFTRVISEILEGDQDQIQRK